METDSRAPNWADRIVLTLTAILLGPIVLVALVPVVLTIALLWPLLILPWMALSTRKRPMEAPFHRHAPPLRHPVPQAA